MRHGADARLEKDRKSGRILHTVPNVYGEMLRQICLDYQMLPDPRTLSMTEIRYFYNGERGQLQKNTAPQAKTRTPTPRAARPRRRR